MAGVGSFVADRQARAHPLEIRSIADEIRERGHAHRAEIVSLEQGARTRRRSPRTSGMRRAARCSASVLVHFENEAPIQLEERYVLPRSRRTISPWISAAPRRMTT